LKWKKNEASKIEKGDIYITYKEKGNRFKIKLVDCIRANGKWMLMDRIWWYKTL